MNFTEIEKVTSNGKKKKLIGSRLGVIQICRKIEYYQVFLPSARTNDFSKYSTRIKCNYYGRLQDVCKIWWQVAHEFEKFIETRRGESPSI